MAVPPRHERLGLSYDGGKMSMQSGKYNNRRVEPALAHLQINHWPARLTRLWVGILINETHAVAAANVRFNCLTLPSLRTAFQAEAGVLLPHEKQYLYPDIPR